MFGGTGRRELKIPPPPPADCITVVSYIFCPTTFLTGKMLAAWVGLVSQAPVVPTIGFLADTKGWISLKKAGRKDVRVMKQHRNHVSVGASCAVFALVLLCACIGNGSAQDQAPPASPAQTAPAAAAGTAAPAAAADADAPQPKFVVPEPTFNFGDLDANTVVNHDFILRNEGKGVLEIKDVKPGCGCTTTTLESKTLQPGQEEKLNASLNLKGRQGKLTKTVMVTTNDPANASVILTLTGSAIAPIAIDPETISIPTVEDDNPRSATLKVVARKEDAVFNIKEVKIDDMDFMETEVKTVTPGKEYSIEIRSKGPLPVGVHSGRVIITTDYPDRTIIFSSVNVQVVGPMLVMPAKITLGSSDKPGETASQQISVEPGRMKEFNLTGAVAPVEGMKADIRKMSDNHYVVALSDMPLDGSLDGKELILKTDSAASPEMRVPFKVLKPRTGAGAPSAPKPAPPALPSK